MSDVFNNDTGRKQKILSLLQVPSLPEGINVESVLHPRNPPETSQPKYSVLDVAHFIKEHRIKAFRPTFIPEVELVPLDEDITTPNIVRMNETVRANQLRTYEKLFTTDARPYYVLPEGEVYLPVGDTMKLMSYKPTYYNKDYDQKLLNAVTFWWTGGEQKRPTEQFIYMGDTVTVLLDAINNTMLSTGTWPGQFNRWIAMRDIRYGLKGKIKPLTLSQCGITLESFARELEHTLPITDELDTFSLTSVPSAWVYEDATGGLYDELPSIRSRSTAGPPFTSGFKKGSVITSCIIMMDNILMDTNLVLKGKMTTRQFVTKYYYLFCGYMFPKEERYDKADVLKKTRNIIAMNMPSHLLIGMILEPIDKVSKFNALNFDTPSLKGFSPWKGGMHLMVQKILGLTQTTDFIYADNWYIIYLEPDGTFTYFSIDNEKAEANATPDIAQAIMYYLLSRGFIKDNAIQFSATWAYLALNILPATAVDNVAVFRNIQLRVPGLSSGSRMTFHVNHAITTKHRMVWRQHGSPRPGTPEFQEVNKRAGVNVKVELEVSDIKAKLVQLIVDTPRDGILQEPESNEPSKTDWPIVRLDLLGYDVCYSNDLGIYIPVLAEDRLFRSAAYPKKTEKELTNPIVYKYFRMVRYVTLNMMGAYTRPLLFKACQSLAQDVRGPLKITLANKPQEFPAESLGPNDDLLPTLLEVLDMDSLNLDFDCDWQMMRKLHSPVPQPQAPSHKIADYMSILQLRKRSQAVSGNISRDLTALPLMSVMIPTVVDKIEIYQKAKRIVDMEADDPEFFTKHITDWAEESESLLNMMAAEADMKSAFTSTMDLAIQALDSLLVPDVDYNKDTFIPAIYEKDPDKLSNPIINYHLPYAPKHGILEQRKLQGASPMTRTQKKNFKKKNRNMRTREELLMLKEAQDRIK